MPEMSSERRINPEWQALEGKPHLVPVNCLPDQYKVIKVGLPPTCTEECKRCGEELTYKHDDSEVKCPSCMTKYYVGVDAEFVDGSWRDLTKLTRA